MEASSDVRKGGGGSIVWLDRWLLGGSFDTDTLVVLKSSSVVIGGDTECV